MSTPDTARSQIAIGAWLSSLLVLVIIAMVNYLAYRHYQRFDWTSQGIFTLSAKSKEVLRTLPKDVDIYVFLSRGEPSFEQSDELLKRYVAATPRVHVHYVDPDREPAQFKLLAQRFGISAGSMDGSSSTVADVAAVVANGDKSWHVKRDDLSGFDADSGEALGQENIVIKAEQAFTGAVVQVMSGRPTQVCITQGHGEWSLEDNAERSLTPLKNALSHDNVVWKAFETLGQTSVPKDCDAVFVLGPVRAVSAAEAKLLMDYTRSGGNLLLALDPVISLDQVATTGFEDPLRELGIRLDRSLVLELSQDRLLSPNAAEFLATDFGDHETTRPLQQGARVFITMARSVTALPEHQGLDILMRTSEQGFGKTTISEIKDGVKLERGPGDIQGPAGLAVATRIGKNANDPNAEHAPGGRLIVIGDSDFIQGPLLGSDELANFHLASAWTGWLTERPALIAIPPKKIKSGNLVLTAEDLEWLRFRVAVLIPAAAFVLGLAVWLNRRS